MAPLASLNTPDAWRRFLFATMSFFSLIERKKRSKGGRKEGRGKREGGKERKRKRGKKERRKKDRKKEKKEGKEKKRLL